MKAFRCRVCGNTLFLENSTCVSCGTALAFSRAEREIVPLTDAATYTDAAGTMWFLCRNVGLSGCTWLATQPGAQCFACDLTRTRPNDDDAKGMAEFRRAEEAKRHLVVELDTLHLPVRSKVEDAEQGLCFDLLSSVAESVTIGHEDGVITIDLAESDPVHREKVREQLAEPYRTMLGHFRHEVGHYYEWQLVTGDLIEQARALFGDETRDYQAELRRHYDEGPPADWAERYISTYATMHPFEDFAETFAHYLHISDTVETAGQFGLTAVAPEAFGDFADLVRGVWVPLSTALNQINRSMGAPDLYPFVIPGPVVDKLSFVAALPRTVAAV